MSLFSWARLTFNLLVFMDLLILNVILKPPRELLSSCRKCWKGFNKLHCLLSFVVTSITRSLRCLVGLTSGIKMLWIYRPFTQGCTVVRCLSHARAPPDLTVPLCQRNWSHMYRVLECTGWIGFRCITQLHSLSHCPSLRSTDLSFVFLKLGCAMCLSRINLPLHLLLFSIPPRLIA